MSVDWNIGIEHWRFDGVPVYLYAQKMMTGCPTLGENAKLTVRESQSMVDAMVFQMTSWCASGRIPTNESTETVEYPDGPWQAIKEKYFPEWWLDRWPPRMKTREIKTVVNHYFVCPHVSVPRDHGLHIQFMATGTPLAQKITP